MNSPRDPRQRTSREVARREADTLRKRISQHMSGFVGTRRRGLALTQSELGGLTGMHATMVSNLEAGAIANPSIAQCIMLARALDCSLSDLIGLEFDGEWRHATDHAARGAANPD